MTPTEPQTEGGRKRVGRDDEWTREALRLCDRYVREVVLDFALCPWAEGALRADRVARQVCLAEVPTAGDCDEILQALARPGARRLDIGLLVFPRFVASMAAFDGFAERVRRAILAHTSQLPATPAPTWQPLAGKTARGRPSGILVAAFHPEGSTSFDGPHQLTSFLRRTPDPMLQFVRAELIEELQDAQPQISQTVALRNHQALIAPDGGSTGDGAAGTDLAAGRLADRLDHVVRAIRADRDRSYAALVI